MACEAWLAPRRMGLLRRLVPSCVRFATGKRGDPKKEQQKPTNCDPNQTCQVISKGTSGRKLNDSARVLVCWLDTALVFFDSTLPKRVESHTSHPIRTLHGNKALRGVCLYTFSICRTQDITSAFFLVGWRMGRTARLKIATRQVPLFLPGRHRLMLAETILMANGSLRPDLTHLFAVCPLVSLISFDQNGGPSLAE